METPFCVSNYSNNSNSHLNERICRCSIFVHSWRGLLFHLCCYSVVAAVAVAAFSKSIIAVTIIMIITIIVLCSFFFIRVQSLFVLIKSCVWVCECAQSKFTVLLTAFLLVSISLSLSFFGKRKRKKKTNKNGADNKIPQILCQRIQ